MILNGLPWKRTEVVFEIASKYCVLDMYGCESWTVKKAERRRIDALNCGVGEDS